MTRLELAQLRLTRAEQRYESSKAACREMYGSLSILVVPQPDFQVLAEASWEVARARNALGDLKARRRLALVGALRWPSRPGQAGAA